MGSRTRQRRRRGRRLGRRLGRWAWRALLAVLALAIASTLPVLALRWIDPPTSAFMLWREREARIEGEAGFAIDYRWRDLEAIAPSLPLALVAAEDQRFPDHHGFDVEAIRQALAERADGGSLRGASTISQQVAKNLFLWSGRSFVRKGLEAWFTALVELAWPKRRILEVYANIAEFGDGIYGAEAAAQRHFGRPAAALSPSQAARLAAVLPAPRRDDAGRPSDYVLGRQLWIERQMRQLGPGYLEPIGLPPADR